MKRTPLKRVLRISGIIVATPIVLFLVLASLLYIPALQQWAVEKVTHRLSESTGMRIQIGTVRLAFPLDLALLEMKALEGKDTLLDASALRLNVALLPLLHQQIEVDGAELFHAKVNTKELLSDIQIRGEVGHLHLTSHGVSLADESVCVNRFLLEKANLSVALSDTAKQDTSTTKTKWKINVKRAKILQSKIHLSMPGDRMRIGADIGALALKGGLVDLGPAAYAVKKLTLSKSSFTYDLPYEKRVKGLDVNHLSADGLRLDLRDFSYRGGTLALLLQDVALNEKCGLSIKGLKGELQLDTTALSLPAFQLHTPTSHLYATAKIPWRALKKGQGGQLQLDVDGAISKRDILVFAGAQRASLKDLYPNQTLQLRATVAGNRNHIELRKAELRMPHTFRLSAKGTLLHPFEASRRSGQIRYDLATQNLAFVKELTSGAVHLPNNIQLKGGIHFAPNTYGLTVKGQIEKGKLDATAHYNVASHVYAFTLKALQLPVGTLLPGKDLSDFTGSAEVRGRGFKVLSKASHLQGNVKIKSFQYGKIDLDSIELSANIKGGAGHLHFSMTNDLLSGLGTIALQPRGKMIEAKLSTELKKLNIQRLTNGADPIQLAFCFNAQGYLHESGRKFGIEGGLTAINIVTPKKRYPTKDLLLKFEMSPDSTHAQMQAGDLTMRFECRSNLEKLSTQIDRFVKEVTLLRQQRRIDPKRLRQYIPQTRLFLSSGKDNPICNILRFKGYSYDRMLVDLTSSPQKGFNGEMLVHRLNTGSLSLDTTRLQLCHDSTGLQLIAHIKNKEKDNPYLFTTRIKAYTFDQGVGLEAVFKDKDNREGVNLGLRANMVNKGVHISVYPKHPILAFRRFEVNDSNYIFLGKDKRIDANIDLLADDGTRLKIFSVEADSAQDLSIGVHRLNLKELSSALPFFPQIGGWLNGEVHMIRKNGNLTFTSSLKANQMTYEHGHLGNLGMEAIYLPKNKTEHFVKATLQRDQKEILLLDGIYNDVGAGKINATCNLKRFPLSMINGFIPDGVISMAGYGDGILTLNGSTTAPIISGDLLPDSAYLVSKAYGLNLKMEKKNLSILNNHLRFDDFAFYSTGTEPLLIQGAIDFKEVDNVTLDLKMNANNFELINAKRTAQSLVYGNVHTNFEGSLRGNTRLLTMRGNLNILNRTNVSYILKDSPLSVDDRLGDLVKFVSFRDTTTTVSPTSTPLGLNMLLSINVSDAARAHCDLSSDGQSYIDLEGGGQLTMKYTPQGEMSLTGRYTVNSGEMKYALPVIPLKTFTLTNGSSISFTGDALNPVLNISAKERIKASVSEDGNARNVAFDVGVELTKPLDQMGLEFTIEAPEDLTVQNQLAAMSREQRAKLSVSMLATGMYLAENNNTAFNANNALNSFLQSEIQNIAGNALKTIDLSVGVEDGTSADGSSRTDYSFRFAKRFWGNRVSVIIGGKVSAGGSSTDNQAESFIDNVSLEYRLDKSSSRYVKVFYDRNSQDPLEGQIVTTGAGLVLRKKTNNLGELFIFRKSKDHKKLKKERK